MESFGKPDKPARLDKAAKPAGSDRPARPDKVAEVAKPLKRW